MKPSKSDKKSGVRASRFACCLMAIAMVFFGVPLGVAETPPVPAKPPAKLSAFPAPNLAQPQSPKGFEAGMEKTIFLDLRDINVIDVFKFIAVQGSLNIVTSKNVQGRSTLLLKDVKIKDALDILAISNQLAYEVRNNILYIMTEDEYAQTHGKNFNDKKKIMIRTLKTAKPSYAMAALQGVQSSIGKVIIDEDTGTIVMIDIPEKLMEMNGILDKVELNLKTTVIKLQFAKADDVAAQLKPQIEGKGVGSVLADARSNQIFLTAYPDRLDDAVKMVRALDKQTKAVLIEARILQLTLNPSFQFGIDWEKAFPANGKDVTIDNNFNYVNPVKDPTTGRLVIPDFGKFSVGQAGDNFIMNIKAMKEVANTKVLANPRLMILDRQEAKINIGQRIPYVVSTTTATSGTEVGISQDVRFIDVGIILAVSPIINDDGYVTMKIRPEISSQTGEVTAAVTALISNKIPKVTSTYVESTVIVRDGVSAILGGMIRDEMSETNKGVPYLMDIPLIGNAFKSRDESITKTEIVIVITPHIVDGSKDTLDQPMAIKGKTTGNIRSASFHESTLDPPPSVSHEALAAAAAQVADQEAAGPAPNSLSGFFQKLSPIKKGKA